MGRLIDAEKLIEIFNHDLKCFETDGKAEEKMYISVADMRKVINEQPTAYDVEKVVATLEDDLPFIEADDGGGTFIHKASAIKIVRRGGVE